MATMASCIHLMRKAALSNNAAVGRVVLSSLGAGQVQYESKRGAKKWYPDHDFFRQFEGVVLYPEEARWSEPLVTNGKTNHAVVE